MKSHAELQFDLYADFIALLREPNISRALLHVTGIERKLLFDLLQYAYVHGADSSVKITTEVDQPRSVQ